MPVLAVPALAVALFAARPGGATLLTGFGPAAARDAAQDVLPLMVLAACAQLYAGLAASALAALDDYLTAAISYIAASFVGLGYILVRVDEDGVMAVAVGMALNGAPRGRAPDARSRSRVRGRRRCHAAAFDRRASRFPGGSSRRAAASALPLALQAVYLVSLPFAAREGVGAQTSFGYAYLAAAALVAVTSSSLGLVTSVPLTRVGLGAASVARHVVSSSWLALVAVGAAAGVFAVAGHVPRRPGAGRQLPRGRGR